MAVRPQHVHDGVVERRLRPIYDWLDNGNNKKALQEVEKVLKKTPSLQAARALKALSLLRLGKNQEAFTVLDALAEEKPSDDSTLQAMTISYRESQQLSKVCSIYENAVKAEPLNEELHSHLFMSYVRVGDFLAQQRAAMALYKFAPKNPYYFWAIMSIVLQAKNTDDTTRKGVLLNLAKRMVENFINEKKMEAEQEARLYIMILELQENYSDALAFMETPLYTKLLPGAMPAASIPYLKKLNLWRRLNLLCKELLWDNHDRWDYYVPYLESTFQLMQQVSSDSTEGDAPDDTPEKCHEFLCQLIEATGSNKAVRGPYLARLELWKRLSEMNGATSLLGGAVDLCLQYLRLFAHKPCAVSDLRPYLPMIPRREREERCREFLTCVGLDEASEVESLTDIQKHINCLGVWHICQPPLDAAAHLSLANKLQGHYLRARDKQLAPSTLTELCAADTYAVLASQHYFYAAMQLNKSEPVLKALWLLELLLKNSPANFHAKLLALKMYHLLGNAGAADTWYLKLEVKHVQLTSLGWLHCARLPAAGRPARALQLAADTCAQHSHHAKDSVDHLTYAYKFGTFEKLVELMSFASRITRCAGAAAAARERAILTLLDSRATFHAPPPLHPLDMLTDNRDLNVMINWEAPEVHLTDMRQETLEHELAFLQLKDALVNAVALSIELAEGSKPSAKEKQLKELESCMEGFSTIFTKFKEEYKPLSCWASVSAPHSCRIVALVNSPVPYRELYTGCTGLVALLARGEAASAGEACARLSELVSAAQASLHATLRERATRGDSMWTARNDIEDISNYLEFIGIITFVLEVCNEIITPATKKSKKKNHSQSPDELKTIEKLTDCNNRVQGSITLLETILDQWHEPDINQDLLDQFTNLKLTESPVQEKLKSGRNEMLIEVRNILKKKSKCLKTLLQ